MNAFLNYATVSALRAPSVAGLRTDSFMNANSIANYMQMPILPIGNGFSDSSAQVLNNIPGGNLYSFPGAQSNSGLEDAVKKGIITEDEMKQALRRSLGFSVDGSDEAYSSSSSDLYGALTGKTLEKAKKSNKGSYAVNAQHSQVASQLVEQVKEVLTRKPSEVSKEELAGLEKVMKDLQKNPMIAEAFLKEANETTFNSANGKTSTFLASYRQLLTSKFGKEEAGKTTDDLLKSFRNTLQYRNKESVLEAADNYKSERDNVEFSFGDKLRSKSEKHPIAFGTVAAATGVGALTTGTYGAYKIGKTVGVKNLCKLGGLGVAAATVAGIGYGVWTLAKD